MLTHMCKECTEHMEKKKGMKMNEKKKTEKKNNLKREYIEHSIYEMRSLSF